MISRKVVGKSARDNPERHCGRFRVHCFSKKFQRIAREDKDVCLRVLKESNKSRFDSYSVRKSALIISHITFWDCHVHSFSDNLPRNSCIWLRKKCRPLCQPFARANSIRACSDCLGTRSYSDCLALTKLIRLGEPLLCGKKLTRLGRWPYYPKRVTWLGGSPS